MNWQLKHYVSLILLQDVGVLRSALELGTLGLKPAEACSNPACEPTTKCHRISCHACHEFFQGPLTMIFMDEQHLFDGALLEAHLIKLSKKTQELGGLRQNSNQH